MRSHEGGVPEPVDGICRTVGDAVSKVGEGLFRVRHEEPGLVLLPKVPERRTKRERRIEPTSVCKHWNQHTAL